MIRAAMGALILGLLSACREDPRIAGMEALADRACTCTTADCAAEIAPRILDIRGLEQEDHANLPADQIARHDQARARGAACLGALDETLRQP